MTGELVPPVDVAATAAQAIVLRNRYGRGGTAGAVSIAEDLASRRPLTTTRATQLAELLAAARSRGRAGWDLAAAPSNDWIRFMLLGGDPALRWLTAALDGHSARVAGLETVDRLPTAAPETMVAVNAALSVASTGLGRAYETTIVKVAGWAEMTVDRAIRAAGARTLDEVRNKARRASLGGQERAEAIAARIASLNPRDRLDAVPEPIRAAVEDSIERRLTQLIAESAVGSLEAILDAFHSRQITEFARLAEISLAEAGALFDVTVPSTNAVRVTSQRLIDLVLGRLDPGELVVGQVNAANGLVPGSIPNDAVLIAGGADVDDTGAVIRDALGRAVGRDGGIADGGVGTFRTRLISYSQRIAARDNAAAKITARLDIANGLPGAPTATQRAELLAQLRGLSEDTPGRTGLGSGTLNGDAGRWIHGGGGPTGVYEPHLDLDGAEWFDLPGSEIVCKSQGGFPYVSTYFPGDHLGCSCWIEPQLTMEVAA